MTGTIEPTRILLLMVIKHGSDDVSCKRSMDWHAETNYTCPPICLILRVLHHMRNCKASNSLTVPLWQSTPFWPIICPDGERFASFRCFSLFLPHLRTLAQEERSQNCLRFGTGGPSLCLYSLLSRNIIFFPELNMATRSSGKCRLNSSLQPPSISNPLLPW